MRTAYPCLVTEISRMHKELPPEGNNCANIRKLLRFSFGGHEGSDATMGGAIPIWANGTFKPSRLRLGRGNAELLSMVDIIKKLDSAVNFGSHQLKVGQSE